MRPQTENSPIPTPFRKSPNLQNAQGMTVCPSSMRQLPYLSQRLLIIRKCLRTCVHTHHDYIVWKPCGCVIIMQLFEITSVVPQTGMQGWPASVHCLTEQFHSTHSSH